MSPNVAVILNVCAAAFGLSCHHSTMETADPKEASTFLTADNVPILAF